MGILSSLFRARDKPQNSTAGSGYRFFLGGTTSGKAVTERSAAQSQEEYEWKYASLSARYEKATENLGQLQNEQRSRELRSVELRAFMNALRDAPLILDSFDTRLWTALVEKAVVHHDGRIVFQLKSGQEIEAGV